MSYPEEDHRYVQFTDRTAFSQGISGHALRSSLRPISAQCRQSKLEVFLFVREALRRGVALSAALDSTPVWCARAAQMDRPLIRVDQYINN